MTSVSDKAILHNPYCLCERSKAISAEEVRGNEALTKIAVALMYLAATTILSLRAKRSNLGGDGKIKGLLMYQPIM